MHDSNLSLAQRHVNTNSGLEEPGVDLGTSLFPSGCSTGHYSLPLSHCYSTRHVAFYRDINSHGVGWP